jgi:hypothetical protein
VFPLRGGEYGWGSAAVSGVEVRVECRENFGEGGYGCFIGSSSCMEGRGCTAVGEEALFNFHEPVGGFRASVIGRVAAGFHLFQFVCGGGAEEVAYACLTMLFDGIEGDRFSRI